MRSSAAFLSHTLFFDKHAGVSEKKGDVEEEDKVVEQEPRSATLRVLRLVSGSATIVAGLVALFVLAMIFHPLVPGAFGGAFTVASFFAGAFALGGVMTAMWLGHWYLVTPALSERPLLFSTTVVLVAVLAQVAFSLAAGPTMLFGSQITSSAHPVAVAVPTPTLTHGSEIKPLNAPQITPLSSSAIGWLHILVGFVMPLVLGGLAWKLVRDRSFQSATGMLYLVVVCALAGEAMARGLFLGHL
jgi:DMSO reductase anchor subunit